jgi:nucleotide-binding universal stress UspA family protein
MRRLPLRSVLVATDLTAESDELVRSAATLARQVGARLHLVHAVEPPAWRADGFGSDVLFMQRSIHEARSALEDQIRRTASGLAPGPTRTVAYERAHTAILQRAKELEVDLLIIGAHRGGLARRVLGTTADRIVRSAATPCLVLPRPLRMPLERVLVPTDFSAQAREALQVSLAWGGALGGQDGSIRVRVLHVAPALQQPGLHGREASTLGIEDDIRSVSSAWRGPAETVLEPRAVLADDPADQVLREADDFEADLLVLGTHGHGALGRALIGSVSSEVARLSPRPVLLVPPRFSAVEAVVPPALPGAATA